MVYKKHTHFFITTITFPFYLPKKSNFTIVTASNFGDIQKLISQKIPFKINF